MGMWLGHHHWQLWNLIWNRRLVCIQLLQPFRSLKSFSTNVNFQVFCLLFTPGTVRLKMKQWNCCWKRQVPQHCLLTAFCCVHFHRLIWEGAMGPLPWWWLKITMHWRRTRSVWIKERWFRSLLSTSRTCSWCTSLPTTTLQPLKDGSLAISWLPSLNPLQIVTTEASSKCRVGFAGSTMWIFWGGKKSKNE